MIVVCKTLFILIFILAFNAIKGQVDPYLLAEQIKMEAALESLGNREDYYLAISFTKTKDDGDIYNFIWNDAHCFFFKNSLRAYSLENDTLTHRELLLYYLQVLPISQLIIENDQGDMETISFNRQYPRSALSDKSIVVTSQMAVPESINNLLSFEYSDMVVFKYRIKLPQLLLRKTDAKIRINYLYIPYEHNTSSPFILTSNWINIPQD